MFESGEINLEILATHYIGNNGSGESLELSKEPVDITDFDLVQTLRQYFLTPFKENGYWHFAHSSDINLNEIYHFAQDIFSDSTTFFINGCNMARHLFNVTSNPNIKSGELHIALFSGIPVDGKIVNAIGLYKTDVKETFLKLTQQSANYEMQAIEGLNLTKMDKACLILDIEEENGYKLLVIDKTNTGNEAVFWKDTFLSALPNKDEFHFTSDVMKMTKQFIADQLPNEYDMSGVDKLNLMQKSATYFKENESYSKDEFAQTVFDDPEIINSFQKFENVYQEDNGIFIDDSFAIDENAFKKNQKLLKQVLKLDKNFHVYIHGRTDLIEKGFDEFTGKHYYKLFFDEES